MLDHLTLTVRDLERSIAFYSRTFPALGYGLSMRFEQIAGFGTKAKPTFWLKAGPSPSLPMHLAFRAPSRRAVDAFHAAALAAGARDDGAPGLRPHYHRHYYAAFVIDPDGHPIEAVCHLPPPRSPVRTPKAKAKKKAARAPKRGSRR